jgi:Secretion system C-terminal sorting domain/Beta-propeller repeat
MKKLLFILTLFFSFSTKSQTIDWAKQIGNPTTSSSNNIASDASGNIYILGGFQLSPDFDPGAGVQTLSSFANSEDVFLAKYDNAGNFLWVKQMGGSFNDRPVTLEVDPSGNAYCYGTFASTASFGSTVLDVAQGEVFLTKIDPSGNFEWAGQLKTHFPRTIDFIGSDILISGQSYATTTDFDMGAGVSNQTFTGYIGQYIARYTTAGVLVWAKIFTGPASTEAQNAINSVYVDASENIYSVNKFKGAIDFDPNAGSNILTAIGPDLETGFFKLNGAGDLQWAKQFGGSTQGISGTITPDHLGNLHITGTLEGTADMDPGAGITNLTSVNYKALYLSKFDINGNFISTRKIDGPASASDYIYQWNSYFKANGKNVVELNVSGNYDLGDGVHYYPSVNVIACYDASNNLLWKEVMPYFSSGTFSETGSNILTVGTLNNNGSNFDVDPQSGPTHVQNINNAAGQIFFRRSSIEPPVFPTFANMTWNGSQSTDWNVPDNWTPYGVPTAITIATINAVSNPNFNPKMTSDATLLGIYLGSGSNLDFNGKILSVTSDFDINGATLNNTDIASDIVINFGGGSTNYFRGSTINDHITINQNSNSIFYEAFQSANTYNFDANFNVNGTGEFNLCYSFKSDFKGNINVNRTIAGQSYIFRVGAAGVGGNFSYINNAGGNTQIGQSSSPILVGGKFDISSNLIGSPAFDIYQITNNTAGGLVNIQNPGTTTLADNNLKVNNLTINGFSGSGISDIRNNIISGNISITEASTNPNQTYFRGNTIGGNTTYTGNTAAAFYEAFQTANIFNGNFELIQNGTGEINLSYGVMSDFKANVTVTRTAAGQSNIFRVGAVGVGGNFSYINNAGGNTAIGNASVPFTIEGKVDIASNPTGNPAFDMYQITNTTPGGIVNIQNPGTTILADNNLKINSLTVNGFSGTGISDVRNNTISGDMTMTEANTNPNITYFRGNTIGGNTIYTGNTGSAFYEAFQTANTFNGNFEIIQNGTGEINTSYTVKSDYKGNVIVSRTAAGQSNIFRVGAVGVGGNFSYINNAGGNTAIGNASLPFTINGKVDIASAPTGNPAFDIYQITNNTAGGIVNIQNPGTTIIADNNLKVSSLTINGFSGTGISDVRNNTISGDMTMTEASTNPNQTYFRGNNIGGNTVYTANSNNILYEGFQAADTFIGDATFIRNNGAINLAYSLPTNFHKGLILNSSTGINFTQPINFKGITNGIIEQLGTQALIIQNINLDKTATAKITLNDPLTVTNSIAFTSGKIATTLGKELIFPDNIGYTGTSDASHVEGPVKKVGNDAFVFPVGGNGKLANLSISAPTFTTDEFRAQYIKGAPANPTLLASGLDHLSQAEYWLLDRPNGNSDVFVTLSWDAARSGLVTSMADLRIAHFDAGIWKNEGNGGTTGNNVAGAIMSQIAVNSFSPFTLASATFSGNPLPLELISFSGKNEKRTNILNWQTANEVNLSHFEIEKSETGQIFEKIGEVKANGGPSEKVDYEFIDSPFTTLNSQLFYRLKMVDLDGKFKYSKIINIENKAQSEITIYPNPTSDYFTISGNEAFEKLQIVDMSGRIVKEFLPQSDNKYSLNSLNTGVYLLKFVGGNRLINSKLILK